MRVKLSGLDPSSPKMRGIVPWTVTRTFGIPLGAVEHGCVTPSPVMAGTYCTRTPETVATLPTWASTRAWIGLVFVIRPQASRLPTCSTEAARAPAAVACVTVCSTRKV